MFIIVLDSSSVKGYRVVVPKDSDNQEEIRHLLSVCEEIHTELRSMTGANWARRKAGIYVAEVAARTLHTALAEVLDLWEVEV